MKIATMLPWFLGLGLMVLIFLLIIVNYFSLGFEVHVLYYLIASVIALFGTYFCL